MNPSTDTAELIGRYANPDPVDLVTERTEQLIARVLCRAHKAAMAVGAPDEARAILDVAQSFANELAAADSEFDRLAFLRAVTEDRS
jgi:hypothetical protein